MCCVLCLCRLRFAWVVNACVRGPCDVSVALSGCGPVSVSVYLSCSVLVLGVVLVSGSPPALRFRMILFLYACHVSFRVSVLYLCIVRALFTVLSLSRQVSLSRYISRGFSDFFSLSVSVLFVVSHSCFSLCMFVSIVLLVHFLCLFHVYMCVFCCFFFFVV